MAIPSKLTQIIATQVGTLQGELESRIKTELEAQLEQFKEECPTIPILKNAINTVNNISSTTSTFSNRVGRLKKLVEPLIIVTQAATVLISLIKSNPIPVAVGTPPGPQGGLLFSQTAGQVASTADKLQKIQQQLDSVNQDIDQVANITQGFDSTLSSINSTLGQIAQQVQECASQVDDEELQDLLQTIQAPIEVQNQQISQNQPTQYRGSNGRLYTLEVIQDNSAQFTIPRRVAVAKDNIGVIVLRGQPSFSSNTQVLLDELKFRIDNQLP